jgi:hypothetical protein
MGRPSVVSAIAGPGAPDEPTGLRFVWERAFLEASLGKTTVVVGLTLATHFDAQLRAFPSIGRLAHLAGCKPQTVRKALKVIEAHRFLHVTRPGPGAGARNTNRYQGLMPVDRSGAEEDRFYPSETVPQGTVSESQNGSSETRKWVPIDTEMGPPGAPNSKEQHKNSAARTDKQSIAEMKRDHPQLWATALDDVDRRTSGGAAIRDREAYAVPTFLDLVEAHRDRQQLEAKRSEHEATVASCHRCDSRGLCWDEQEPPYGLRAVKCNHPTTPGRRPPNDDKQPVQAAQAPLRSDAGAESATERLNLGSGGGVTYEKTR